MNTRTSSVLILTAALSASALIPMYAAPTDAPAIGYWASRVTKTTWDDLLERLDVQTVAPGASRTAVLAAIGRPMRQLAPDVWVYDGFKPDLAQAVKRGCVFLVVTFANDTVENIKFVNRSAVDIVAADLKSKRPGRYASEPQRSSASG
ncbi:MAG TPA: hypothetical protein VLW52_06610 [Opitutaceae bacterium]|nr:hypothetical protein [Opitutaceae bacterium]